MYVEMYVRTYVRTYVSIMYVRIYVCTVCMYVCMYVCVYILTDNRWTIDGHTCTDVCVNENPLAVCVATVNMPTMWGEGCYVNYTLRTSNQEKEFCAQGVLVLFVYSWVGQGRVVVLGGSQWLGGLFWILT